MINRTFRVSSSHHRRSRKAGVAACALAVFMATACGGSTDTVIADQASADTEVAVQDTAPADPAEQPEAEEAEEIAEVEEAADDQSTGDLAVSQGTFDLVLANGESFSVSVGCALGSQIAADQEILYSATGRQDGVSVDVTVWGETTFDFGPAVEVTDSATFDGLWRSVESTGLMIELNGNVITATGGFYPGEDLNGELTQGELTVTC